MQRSRSTSNNVRFAASETSSKRTSVTSDATEESGISRVSSAHKSSVASIPATPSPGPHTPPAPAIPFASKSNTLYEIWEPPDEVAEHYEILPGKAPTTPGSKLGRVIGAALRSHYTGKPFESPRTSLTRTRSVVSESDVSTVSRDELIRDATRLGLPLRTTQPAPAPPRPILTRPTLTRPIPPRSAPPVTPRVVSTPAPVRRPTLSARPVVPPAVKPAPAPVSTISRAPVPASPPISTPTPAPVPAPALDPVALPGVPTSRTMATALTSPTESTNSWGAPVPINPNTYKVWRASIARTKQWSGTSPYTKAIDDAAYGPKPTPPPGTIVESSGEGVGRAERALNASLSTRPVDERIFWTMPADHDERVRNRIKAVDAMSRELALYGLDQYLKYGIKGAIMTNAGYHVPEWPESPAFDWITFEDAQRSYDKTLQESIAYSDPGLTTVVFIFLMSRSGESMAIWRRKFAVPASERLRRDLELRKVGLEAQKRGQVYAIELSAPIPIADEPIVVIPEKKKRRKFPWFKVDWGKSS
ncbi:hypothetical protein RhiJN_19500 [Ceratobasidium sp. AG-Ba]|nr:hypothetical protein RhiJN_19500 [Ceratobasidium sp. AG-Ba]